MLTRMGRVLVVLVWGEILHKHNNKHKPNRHKDKQV